MVAYNIGDRVGDYEIIDVLGAGGMGKVYKVRNVISDRVEAMKVLLPNLASDADLAERFMREIKVQASLHHQNIAALHTALRVNNQLLMLIEFVEGSSIESALRQGPIPVSKAVDYIKQVLLALAYAHSHGVVHRDIKPANMMLTPGGVVKLMDFGIAKLSADRKLTQTGRTVGSLYYMSPEQIQGAEDLGPRADLYSLGVSLYEMVTRTRPFQGDSDYSIMAAHLNSQPVPPVQLDPTLPSALSDVILMAIAKDPDQRFQTADAFRKALESVEGQFRSGGSITKVVNGGARAAAAATTAPLRPGQSVPPPVPQQQPQITPGSSKRGIYMAVGSLVTVGVLAVAALQGPKWFKGSEAASVPPTSTAVTQQQIPITGSAQPTVAPPVQQQAQQPIQQPPSVNVTAQSSTPQVSTAVPQRRVVAQNVPPANAQAPIANQVSQVPTQAPAVTPQQQPPQTQPPAAPAVDTAKVNALREAREHLVMLGTRANAARASLTRMKEQQARQGLGMRGDITASEQRMAVYLDDAQDAIKAGDPERAKKALATAEREIDKLDTFLGR
jgi:eukaryotic-like serine/threonine-protein kinase